jgi:purine-binding chemotaxis protein CheW
MATISDKSPLCSNVSIEGQNISIAATADAVKDVIEIDDAEIKPVPEMGISYDAKLIAGAIRRNDRFVMLLDMHKMFLSTDLAFAEAKKMRHQLKPSKK